MSAFKPNFPDVEVTARQLRLDVKSDVYGKIRDAHHRHWHASNNLHNSARCLSEYGKRDRALFRAAQRILSAASLLLDGDFSDKGRSDLIVAFGPAVAMTMLERVQALDHKAAAAREHRANIKAFSKTQKDYVEAVASARAWAQRRDAAKANARSKKKPRRRT